MIYIFILIFNNLCLFVGKTLAYVLPIIEILRSRYIRKIRCLIVLPVQELAAQVYNVVKSYASHSKFEHTRLKVGLVSGAASFEKEQEGLISKGSSSMRINLPSQLLLLSNKFQKRRKFIIKKKILETRIH